ncbi:MAG: rhodanese-like domain-containing protein [Lentisphaerae bacterium]|nr:rhodanese-like domain-containing protein [Lentisphaerota bacterium]
MKLFSIVPMVCVLALGAAAGPADPAGTNVPDIRLEELKKAIADKTVVLIDCNGSKSYANGHIPGAIDFQANALDLAQALPKDKAALVVVYCKGPTCGAYTAAADAATQQGYTNVKHFSGGISGWEKAGEKLEVPALCEKCGLVKGSPGCCKPAVLPSPMRR